MPDRIATETLKHSNKNNNNHNQNNNNLSLQYWVKQISKIV